MGVNSGMDGAGWKALTNMATTIQFTQRKGAEIISICDLISFTMNTVTFQAVFRFILVASYFVTSYPLIAVRCFVFGRKRSSSRSWRTGLLGVVKWRGVGICLEHLCDKINCTYDSRENTLDLT